VSKPPPRNLTPALCEHLRQKMLQSCKAIAEEHGLVIQGSPLHEVNLRYGFNFTIEVGIPMSDGTILEPGRALFEVLAGDFGLNASDFGREFRANGEAFRITGLSPRRPKYPIDAERLSDRGQFKFTAENVVLYLRASNS